MSNVETAVDAPLPPKIRPIKVIIGFGAKNGKEDRTVVTVRKTFADGSTGDASMSVKDTHSTWINGVEVVTSVDCVESVPVYDANGKVLRTVEYRQNGMCLPLTSQKRKDSTVTIVNTATGELM